MDLARFALPEPAGVGLAMLGPADAAPPCRSASPGSTHPSRAVSRCPRHDRGALPPLAGRGLRLAGDAGRQPHALAPRARVLVFRDLPARAEPGRLSAVRPTL